MPFKVDLDRCPIDVGADKYVTVHSPVDIAEAQKGESIISATLTVPATAKTLAELLAAVVTTETAEDLATADVDVLTYSGTVAPHPAMEIDPDTFDITLTLTTDGEQTVADDGAGALVYDNDPIFVTGTIDYETGEWEITVVGDTLVDEGDITVDYDWFFVVPAATPAQSLWLTPGAADEIYATWSENGVPTASTGILISEAMFIAGQPTLIANAKFIGNDTAMDVEVLV
jgi:hypothetical protein